MSTVNDITKSFEPIDIGSLPLMHTANGEDFLKILNDRRIRISECRVFTPDKLCYFFLGRPAYKTSVVANPSFWQLPAVFAFHQIPDIEPKRIFPFDSGALIDGRYADIIGKLDRDLFQLPPDYQSVGKLISYFFRNTSRYLDANTVPYDEIRDRINDNMSAFPVLALSKLYNYQFNHVIDDRVKLVELQFDQDIPISKETIKGVILCKEWLRDENIKASLEALECSIESYPIMPLSSANYYSKIYELAQLL